MQSSHDEKPVCTLFATEMTVPVKIKNQEEFLESYPYELKNILTALKNKPQSPITRLKVKELVLDSTQPCSLKPEEVIDWQIQAVESGYSVTGGLFTEETLTQAKHLIAIKKTQAAEEKTSRVDDNFISANLIIGGVANLAMHLVNPCANFPNIGISLFASFATSLGTAVGSTRNSHSIIKKILFALTPTTTVFVPKLATEYFTRACAPVVPYVAVPVLIASGAAWHFRASLMRAGENCCRFFHSARPSRGDIEAPFMNDGPRTPRSPL